MGVEKITCSITFPFFFFLVGFFSHGRIFITIVIHAGNFFFFFFNALTVGVGIGFDDALTHARAIWVTHFLEFWKPADNAESTSFWLVLERIYQANSC